MRIALTTLETARLADVLALLLAPPLDHDADAWRVALARALRTLVGAQMAALTLETPAGTRTYGDRLEPAAARAYERHYRALDHGLRRQRALGLEVWSRARLWTRAQLTGSEYYNDFARPNGIHDTVGLAIALPTARVHAMASLIHDRPMRSPAARERQLALLTLVLPAFRVGVTAHLRDARGRLAPGLDPRTGLLDATDEPQALYSRQGRLLYRNRAMATALGDEGQRLALRQAVSDAARAAAAVARAEDAPPAATRAVRTATATYRVRAGLVADDESRGASVLVSLRRNDPAPASADELRARFGLTGREAEVAVLLLQRRSNAEIAEALELSEHTARHHTERVLHKLGVNSRIALAEALAAPQRAPRG